MPVYLIIDNFRNFIEDPDNKGHYAMTPEDLQQSLWRLAEKHLLNIIGGCCGTTEAHIEKLSVIPEPIKGCILSPHCKNDKTVSIVAPAEEVNGIQKDHVHQSEQCECCKPKTEKASTSKSAEDVFTAILNGKSDMAADATRQAIDEGISPQEIINGQMIRAMSEVGQRFQDGKAFVPQLLMAGRAMKAALELLKPMLSGTASATIGKVVIGTVKGDLHDIGKNLVASMLEGCGFEVVNIGIDVDSETFVKALKDNQADILCMSALLTTTMTYMKDVIKALEDSGLRDKVKVMVGGAPVSQEYANEIGADGYSDNANSAVTVAKRLLGK